MYDDGFWIVKYLDNARVDAAFTLWQYAVDVWASTVVKRCWMKMDTATYVGAPVHCVLNKHNSSSSVGGAM